MHVRVSAMCFCMLIKLMQEHACSYAELAEETGLHNITVRKWVTEMKRQRLIHIADWGTLDNNHKFPLFRWGCALDKPMPVKTYAQRNREYRQRLSGKRKMLAITHAIVGTLHA